MIMGAMQHEDAGDDLDGPSPKKQRHVWTSEAHHKFINIVEGLGDSKQACPSFQQLDKQTLNMLSLFSAVAAAWRRDAAASKGYPDLRQPQHVLPCQGMQCFVQGLFPCAFWT
jgi:hypothetical protein